MTSPIMTSPIYGLQCGRSHSGQLTELSDVDLIGEGEGGSWMHNSMSLPVAYNLIAEGVFGGITTVILIVNCSI